MKKLFIILAALVSTNGLLSSCKDDSKDPLPAVEYAPVIFPKFTEGKSTFDFKLITTRPPYPPGFVLPEIEFTFDPGDQRDTKLAAVEVYKTFRRTNATSVDNSKPTLVGTYTSFPATVRLNGDEAIADIKRLNAAGQEVQLIKLAIVPRPAGIAPDAFVFTFEYILQDGRRIVLTPRDKNGVLTGAQTNAPFAAVASIVQK
ncbi:hypothetical protein SAMN02745146_1114 [Hymenobacter daecheongensis DSM 21074]|uniref:Uncharacterized protein n=1 Tax=Hymenobacter daecheongensis DSM 21074 TaxID=1121955 RepID=A0A1M6CD10_9BACT|nr:hypothetical protein [Hymenobacter daecheongensis]SHI58899.1 hypothetical protein SAMN02745146_1114 [Hymenobacter daecheongensis DSM 21074]